MRTPLGHFHGSPEMIRLTETMYVRNPLSLRRVQDLPFEPGIDIGHETIRFRRKRLGPVFAAEIG